MQALTPLLFSMLFPRLSNGNTNRNSEGEYSGLEGGDYPHESLLNGQSVGRRASTSSNERSRSSFQDGYPTQDHLLNDQQYLAAKARRHRSTGSARRSATDPTSNSSSSSRQAHIGASSNNASGVSGSGLSRNNTFPQSRRAGPPKRLSLDHAAFIATYPMLDGLGDTSSRHTSNSEYYAPILTEDDHNIASSSRSLRKQRSQDMPPSRTSTSSISSMVSDASSFSSASSVSSSCSSVHEPLTPTRSPTNYRSILSMDSTSAKSKRTVTKSTGQASAASTTTTTTKDLINLHSFGEDEGQTCLSPQSSNFFNEEEVVVPRSTAAVSFGGARGQRQLIAH